MNKLNLNSFFPEDLLQLTKVEPIEETIYIYLKSKTKSCACSKCGQSTEQYHGTYVRQVQDEETHHPITLLDGRDGTSLRKWLKNNKHIKVVTRDRASAYANVIAEELPDAMQVADRFHLHQNLLEAIKKALNHELPATIKIPHNDEPEENRETGKKIAQDVDNSRNYSEKRYKMICQIQHLLKEGCSYREIARRMGVGRNTIAKYRTGDPQELSIYGIHQSKLDVFHDFILECLYSGKSKSKTVKSVYAKGYTGSKSNAFNYLVKIEQREGKTFEPQPYIRTQTEALKYRTGSKGKTADYITKEGMFKHMWMDISLTDIHKCYIYSHFPNLWELHTCIREFRNIFKKKMVVLLYLFIDKYKKSRIKELHSFAKGLENDLDAVENAVAYDYSNGFVEGTNSRLKMIKRTMYGKCNRELLEAKLCYMRQEKNG